jgi:hypothetical protein
VSSVFPKITGDPHVSGDATSATGITSGIGAAIFGSNHDSSQGEAVRGDSIHFGGHGGIRSSGAGEVESVVRVDGSTDRRGEGHEEGTESVDDTGGDRGGDR